MIYSPKTRYNDYGTYLKSKFFDKKFISIFLASIISFPVMIGSLSLMVRVSIGLETQYNWPIYIGYLLCSIALMMFVFFLLVVIGSWLMWYEEVTILGDRLTVKSKFGTTEYKLSEIETVVIDSPDLVSILIQPENEVIKKSVRLQCCNNLNWKYFVDQITAAGRDVNSILYLKKVHFMKIKYSRISKDQSYGFFRI